MAKDKVKEGDGLKSVKEEAMTEDIREDAAKDGEKRDDTPVENAGAEDAEDVASEANAAEKDDDAETKYLRLAADFQNYKKRNEKERFTRYADGKRDFAADLLPVLDNFDRAIAEDIAEGAGEQYLEGMRLILEQLEGALAKNGVEEIKSLGEVFDPNFHHAVSQAPSEEYESGMIMEVLQKGYISADRVIRPAMVVVAS